MNPDPENFESLRRLLAWKRHEQPPPGYFNDFSRRVLARIEAGEQVADGAGFAARLHRFWMGLQARPAFAGAFGAAVCAFLVVGLAGSEEAPIVTYQRDPAPARTDLGTAARPGSDAAAPPAGWMLVASTNSNDSLRAMFDQSFVSAETVGANRSLLGDH